jgi:hypothetical protein
MISSDEARTGAGVGGLGDSICGDTVKARAIASTEREASMIVS